MDKYRSREFKRQLRTILLSEWDPIGVSGIPEAWDEYDSYVGEVLSMLKNAASVDELTTYLHSIETERMGLRPRKHCDHTSVAAKIVGAFHVASEKDAA
jgi:hypothetical protein